MDDKNKRIEELEHELEVKDREIAQSRIDVEYAESQWRSYQRDVKDLKYRVSELENNLQGKQFELDLANRKRREAENRRRY